MNWAEQQAEFMRGGEQTIDKWNLEQAKRYAEHMEEEASETNDALDEGDYTKALDGAIDTIYVALGFINSLGIDANWAWSVVHSANMRKLVNGKQYRREDGQIGKPPGWVGPESELAEIVKIARKDG